MYIASTVLFLKKSCYDQRNGVVFCVGSPKGPQKTMKSRIYLSECMSRCAVPARRERVGCFCTNFSSFSIQFLRLLGRGARAVDNLKARRATETDSVKSELFAQLF